MKSFRSDTLKAVEDLVEVGGFASPDEAVLAAIEAWHQSADDPAQRLEAIRLRCADRLMNLVRASVWKRWTLRSTR